MEIYYIKYIYVCSWETTSTIKQEISKVSWTVGVAFLRTLIIEIFQLITGYGIFKDTFEV